jgi:hypothetical protein
MLSQLRTNQSLFSLTVRVIFTTLPSMRRLTGRLLQLPAGADISESLEAVVLHRQPVHVLFGAQTYAHEQMRDAIQWAKLNHAQQTSVAVTDSNVVEFRKPLAA